MLIENEQELSWLVELMGIPTASGRERGVVEWIRRWVSARPEFFVESDEAGNLVVGFAGARGGRWLYITAHLDHPAFVVERVVGPGTLMATFRGGVLDSYFQGARVEVFGGADWSRGAVARGVVTERVKKEPFAECLIELEGEGSPAERVCVGDVARWALPAARIEGDLFHGDACDDLSAVAAALSVMERLRGREGVSHVRLLFTRAEEVGFIGAIAACKLGTIEKGSRVIALENSRSFEDSPIGGGPIVRVGDRISVFSAALTGAVAKVAEKLSGKSALVWQRKLMAGGACEASVFQAYGHEATCVCLPLGNYHNMENLARVQAGEISAARIGPELISVGDYRGMIALLEACATELEEVEPLVSRMEKLYVEKGFVLKE
ncbi:MAG: hypothetical protein JNK58_10995 [Phycisphaerae bacterium]|nr:hypothetical protein [Phycisphaerae bacterium]